MLKQYIPKMIEEKALNSTTQNKNLNKTTDTSKLYENLQYSSKYNKTTQEKMLKNQKKYNVPTADGEATMGVYNTIGETVLLLLFYFQYIIFMV